MGPQLMDWPCSSPRLIYSPFAIADWPTHHVRVNSIYSLIALGIFPTAICFVLFFKLMADIGNARSSLVAYVNTGVAVLIGVIVLHEKLTTGIIVGIAARTRWIVFRQQKASYSVNPNRAKAFGSRCHSLETFTCRSK